METPTKTSDASNLEPNPSETTQEFSLREIIQLLIRRWPLIIGMALLSIAVAWGINTTRDPRYSYTGTIQVGDFTGGSGIQPSTDPSKLAGLLAAGYLIGDSDFVSKFPGASLVTLKITAVPAGTALRLDGEGKRGDEASILAYLEAVATVIVRQCESLLALQRQSLEARVAMLTQQIDDANDNAIRSKKDLTRLDDLSRAYESQLQETGALADAIASKRDVLGNGDSNAQAVAGLLATMALQHARDNRINYQNQLNVELPVRRREIEDALAKSQAALSTLRADLLQSQAQLNSFHGPGIQTPVARASQPIGPSSSRIVGISAAIGLALGMIVSILFDVAVRKQPLGRLSAHAARNAPM